MNQSTKLLATASLISMLMAGAAQADTATPKNDWYLGLSGDLTWLRHSDTGGGGNVDLGYRYSDVRLEAEAGYHGAGGSDGYGSTHYFTYMGNIYYDFNTLFDSSSTSWHIAPYIGGGLGDAAVHYGSNGGFTSTFHHHDNNFAWQGMAGLNFVMPTMPNTDWSIGYRYLGTDNHNLHADNAELGLRFHF